VFEEDFEEDMRRTEESKRRIGRRRKRTKVKGVEPRLEGSFHPSIAVFIGISAHWWKDGRGYKKIPIGEEKSTIKPVKVKTQSTPRQNAVTFEAKRRCF
jgi:hypothetical protein